MRLCNCEGTPYIYIVLLQYFIFLSKILTNFYLTINKIVIIIIFIYINIGNFYPLIHQILKNNI